jgi:Fe-S cluster biogenesis protein NfuA
MSDLNSVVISQKKDGSWHALHTPSGKTSHGLTKDEAEAEMRQLLGMNEQGSFEEPLTNDRFEGVAKEIAVFLEGPVSDMLAAHSGFARLEGYENSVVHVRLGGGCQGCPASTITLAQGVLSHLQDEFGDDNVADISPVF